MNKKLLLSFVAIFITTYIMACQQDRRPYYGYPFLKSLADSTVNSPAVSSPALSSGGASSSDGLSGNSLNSLALPTVVSSVVSFSASYDTLMNEFLQDKTKTHNLLAILNNYYAQSDLQLYEVYYWLARKSIDNNYNYANHALWLAYKLKDAQKQGTAHLLFTNLVLPLNEKRFHAMKACKLLYGYNYNNDPAVWISGCGTVEQVAEALFVCASMEWDSFYNSFGQLIVPKIACNRHLISYLYRHDAELSPEFLLSCYKILLASFKDDLGVVSFCCQKIYDLLTQQGKLFEEIAAVVKPYGIVLQCLPLVT